MEPLGKDTESIDVGRRLRILREERNISMRALARRSGLSANALSMIERGLTSPSVSTLNKLATALEVPITAFFRQEPVRENVVFCKKSQHNRISFSYGTVAGLGGEGYAGRVDGFLLNLENGGSSGPHGIIHTGHELIYCLRGMIEYEVEDKRFILEPGDSLIFSAQLVHRWRNVGSHTANALVVISAFEEGERPGEYHVASMSGGFRPGESAADEASETDHAGEDSLDEPSFFAET
jgi:quercetin dioxygenase-like cupin family protein/DNA-binding XRE family transcriptional regulator